MRLDAPLRANLVIPNIVPNEADITLNHLGRVWKTSRFQGGHRWSTDDLPVSWFAQRAWSAVTRLLELGSRACSTGLISLRQRPPAAILLAVEDQQESVIVVGRTLVHSTPDERVTARQAPTDTDIRRQMGLRDTVPGWRLSQ